jgi:hypothetical protein
VNVTREPSDITAASGEKCQICMLDASDRRKERASWEAKRNFVSKKRIMRRASDPGRAAVA